MSAIVNRFLLPALLCDVAIVTAASGRRHPIIRVPSHEVVPICAKADGPQINNRVEGIVSGRYYIRQVGGTGPESAHITRPDQWMPLVRRCVTADRASLIGTIERLLDTRSGTAAFALTQPPTQSSVSVPAPPVRASQLDAWHNAAHERFLGEVRQHTPVWPTRIDLNHFQLSYELMLRAGEFIPGNQLIDALERANAETRDTVWAGWSMFYPFRRQEIAPRIVTDSYPGQGGTEVLEASLVAARTLEHTLPDFWRLSNDGKASLVRAYREDRTGYPLPLGQTLSPFLAAKEVTEIVRHARAMLQNFNGVASVRFLCEWHGLQGRRWEDPNAYYSMTRTAQSDRVVSRAERLPEDLTTGWPVLVAELLSTLARVFDPRLDVTPGWVLSVAPRFRDDSIT